MQVTDVPPATPGSWEHALHQLDAEDRFLLFNPPSDSGHDLTVPLGHRATGVV